MKKFVAISQTYPNDLFRKHWKTQKQQCKGGLLKLGDVVPIWWKALEDCTNFLESLRDRSISLAYVDELLSDYKDEESLHKDIKNLEAGVCECTEVGVGKQLWIKGCIKRMYQYRALREHASAASAFLKLKDALQLTGDFSKVEKLSTEVSASTNKLQSSDDMFYLVVSVYYLCERQVIELY